jgi:hypothetical protein
MWKTKTCMVMMVCILCFAPLSAQEIEYVSSTIWTEVNDIELIDQTAYCAFANGLVIIDFSDVNQPVELGRLYLDGETKSVTVDGNYAYLAGGKFGLQIVNIENPAAPELVSSFSMGNAEACDAVKFGDYVLLADRNNGLYIVDVFIPEDPVEIYQWNQSYLNDLFVYGNLVFAASPGDGVYIFKLENVNEPELIYQIDVGNGAENVFVENDLMYFISFALGVFIYDVSDPYLPEYRGYYNSGLHDLCASGNYLYLADVSPYLHIIDVSDPSYPTLIADYPVSGHAQTLYFNNDTVYIADHWHEIEAVDVSAPSNPSLLGSFDIPQATYSMVLDGSTIYAGGLEIIDIANIDHPSVSGRLEIPAFFGRIDVEGNYAYVTDSYDGLTIIDVSNIENPEIVANYNTPGITRDVKVKDGYAYVAEHELGVHILDVSDPENPEYLTSFEIPGELAQRLFIRDDNLFIAYENAGLVIVDISDPASPQFVSSFVTSHYCRYIHVKDDYAYLSSGNTYYVIDISDIQNPSQVSRWGTQNHGYGLYCDGQYLYMADTDLWICDITGLPNVYSIARYQTPGWATDVYVDGEYIYVCDRSSVMILSFNTTGIDDDDPAIPAAYHLAQNYPNPFNAQTTISYDLPFSSVVRIDIYDILGRKIETLMNSYNLAGSYDIPWKADDLPSGVYLYKIQAGEYFQTRKCVLLK